nr:hypothetical protein [Paenibacillus xylanexedens]
MKKQNLWMTIPVTTAVLLALTGCAGEQSNQASTGSTSVSTSGEQTQTSSGINTASNSGTSGAATGTNTNPSNSADAGTGNEGSAVSNGSKSPSKLSDVNDVVKALRGELKLQHVKLPTSFPLNKGQYLGANIATNRSDALLVNFYMVAEPVALNDSSLTASDSKASWLASYEVKSSDSMNQTELFPETDLKNIPDDMAVDLGHGMKGLAEGAAGSQYLTWQEGRWTLQIHSISEDQMNNPAIAKKIVQYLESHRLPAPKDKGFVQVDYASGGKTVQVTISWQDGKQIHQLKTSQVPLDALDMVVSVK